MTAFDPGGPYAGGHAGPQSGSPFEHTGTGLSPIGSSDRTGRYLEMRACRSGDEMGGSRPSVSLALGLDRVLIVFRSESGSKGACAA